jgi:nicotinamide phosphoribosyltransferase
MKNSILLDTDSYKVSMWKQYPAGTEYVYSYISSRGGKYAKTEFLGVQAFAKRLAKIRITQAEIDYADKIWTAHGEPFNRAGWQYILDTHKGKLPLRIRAAKEGMIIPTTNVLMTIVNTDPKVPWLTTWVETPGLRAIWYPTTVGTMSWHIKQVILNYLEKSGDPTTIGFKLHDFGARGVSSLESAGIGGAAHLVNFMGTDTMSGILHVIDTYGSDVVGFSIPAAEHSTITSWGRDHEVDAYRNMVTQFGKPGAVLAVVSDSYDIYNACKLWGTELKQDVIDSGAVVVIRPDSGDPLEVIPKMMTILEHYYGAPKNAKGYKVLNNVRVIWGDGINAQSLESILRTMVDLHGYSADNFAFGMGGGLLQQCDRDTLKFAMKASAIGIREDVDVEFMGRPDTESRLVWRDVFKDPVTDYYTGVEDWRTDCMETYYLDGEQVFTQTLDQVRANSMLDV